MALEKQIVITLNSVVPCSSTTDLPLPRCCLCYTVGVVTATILLISNCLDISYISSNCTNKFQLVWRVLIVTSPTTASKGADMCSCTTVSIKVLESPPSTLFKETSRKGSRVATLMAANKETSLVVVVLSTFSYTSRSRPDLCEKPRLCEPVSFSARLRGIRTANSTSAARARARARLHGILTANSTLTALASYYRAIFEYIERRRFIRRDDAGVDPCM